MFKTSMQGKPKGKLLKKEENVYGFPSFHYHILKNYIVFVWYLIQTYILMLCHSEGKHFKNQICQTIINWQEISL